jgi:hypothetical protein
MLTSEHLGLAEVPLRYSKEVGPKHQDLSLQVIVEAGMNCQLFAHWVLQELCLLALPTGYLSSHIWADQDFVRPVLSTEPLQVGDIIFFYRQPVAVPSQLHLSVVIGKSEDGQPAIIHCVRKKDPTQSPISIWSPQQFMNSKVHKYLYGSRRIIVQHQRKPYRGVRFDASVEHLTAIPYPEMWQRG